MLGHLLTRFSIIQKMAVEVVRYTEDYLPELTIFCQKCKELGWKNNASIQALKLESPNVQYWLIFVNGEIASIDVIATLQPLLPSGYSITLLPTSRRYPDESYYIGKERTLSDSNKTVLDKVFG